MKHLGEKSKNWCNQGPGKEEKNNRDYIFYSFCENSRWNWLGYFICKGDKKFYP